MKRMWVCSACSKPCLLLFWSGVERRDFKGTACCGSLEAKTRRIEEPVQARLV